MSSQGEVRPAFFLPLILAVRPPNTPPEGGRRYSCRAVQGSGGGGRPIAGVGGEPAREIALGESRTGSEIRIPLGG
jgi:hypothetical protein